MRLDLMSFASGFILSIFSVLSFKFFRKVRFDSELCADIAQMILALVASSALCVSIIGYRDAKSAYDNAKEIELTKSTVEVRRRLLDSISDNSRAAIALINLPDIGHSIIDNIAKSIPIREKKLNKSAKHYGRFVKDSTIDAESVNKLRFALVKEMNEYEYFVKALNFKIVNCEQVFDLIIEISQSPDFTSRIEFAKKYDEFSPRYIDPKMQSWGIVRNFRDNAGKILDRAEKNKDNIQEISAIKFCDEYNEEYTKQNNTFLLGFRETN